MKTPSPVDAKHPTFVYIANMSEDVWQFISSISDKHLYEFEIQDNMHLSDRDIFAQIPNGEILCIFPKPASREFISYYQSLIGVKNIRIITPKSHSGLMCEDIMRDDAVMQELRMAGSNSCKLTMVPYTTSIQFLSLVDTVRKQGIVVSTPESPEEEDAWTVNFFGSKSGVRQLAQKSGAVEPDFRMPDGVICVGIDDACRIAANKYVENGSVVLKTNKGHSGSGVLLFRPGELPDEYHACAKRVYELLSHDRYWDRFPIIIEDYIEPNMSVGCGFPNVEFKILKSGKVEFLYYCGMRVNTAGQFCGVEIHNSVVSDKVEAQMVDTGFYVGEQYAKAGYRGYYEIDFIAGKNGRLYVTESNVRRTGGTHVYHTAVRLFGKEFMYETYVLSDNSYKLPEGRTYTFQYLYTLFQPILFNKSLREGLIIVSETRLTRGQMQYIIFGKNKKRAYEIEARMVELLQAG